MSDRKNQRKHEFTVYKSYSFVDKDPVIDRIRTIIEDEGVAFKKVADLSGVSVGTIYNWLTGPTRRPQFASIVAVIRSLGYDVQITERRHGHRVSDIRMPKLKVVSSR